MTLAVDFDGVIHRYSHGWANGTIYDPPMPGALAALRTLLEHEAVVIHTTRDRHQVVAWLDEHELPARADSPLSSRVFWRDRSTLLVSNRKYAARAYLDDRAVRFTTWDRALAELLPEETAGTARRRRASDAIADAFDIPRRRGPQWHAWLSPPRTGTDNRVGIHLTRSGGTPVTEADADWVREVLNGHPVQAPAHAIDAWRQAAQRADESHVQLLLIRDLLTAHGFLDPAELNDGDLAPRLGELLSHHRQRAEEAEADANHNAEQFHTMRAHRDKLQTALTEVLATFIHDAHPGELKQSRMVRTDTLARWRAALTAPPAQPRAETRERVCGMCPACRHQTLFVGDGGYLTCGYLTCPEPDAAATLLDTPPDETGTVPCAVPPGEAAPDAAACCSCGSPQVTYRNYLAQPFCGRCADGAGPATLEQAIAEAIPAQLIAPLHDGVVRARRMAIAAAIVPVFHAWNDSGRPTHTPAGAAPAAGARAEVARARRAELIAYFDGSHRGARTSAVQQLAAGEGNRADEPSH